MKKILLMAICCLAVMTAKAVKADPTPVSIVQSDGTILTVMGYGDEDFHWYSTSDGVLLVRKGYDYHVAVSDDEGKLVASGILAHEKGKRPVHEMQLAASQDRRQMIARAHAYSLRQNATSMAKIGIGTKTPPYFPHTGTPKCLILLVEFSDVKFTVADPYLTFSDYLNADGEIENRGLREDRNYGSVKKFFTDMSDGQYVPQFDIVKPVTLDKTSAYYGANENIKELLIDVCKKVQEEKGVDFSQYDADNDGSVDLVYIIYAGYSESISGNSSDDIWPKSGVTSLTEEYIDEKGNKKNRTILFNDKKIERYGVNNELNYYPSKKFKEDPQVRVNGIGLFCHEFSHTLGLPDLYPKDDAAKIDNQEMEYWDIMDGGEYTDNGYTPTPYTPWEKEVMGWKIIETLDEPQYVELAADEARKITCEGSEEYVILHNVQGMDYEGETGRGWAKQMMGHGLMIYRIDYKGRSSVNLGDYPNNTPGSPGITVVPADSLVISVYRINRSGAPTEEKPYTDYDYQMSHFADPYPGLVGTTQVDSITLNNAILRKPIYTISEDRERGTVSFRFLDENIVKKFTVDANTYTVVKNDENIVKVANSGDVVSGELEVPSSVTYHEKDYFVNEIAAGGYENLDITSVVIPESIETIGENAFAGCSAIENVTVYATVPPTATKPETASESSNEAKKDIAGSSDDLVLFDESVYQTAILYVPEGTTSDYAEANGWKQFEQILEIGKMPDAISLTKTQTKRNNGVYTIDGRRITSDLSTLAPGIYIYGNKKVIVK